jgi:hypothetical protein
MILTALWHYGYAIDRLRAADYGVKRGASPGVDGQTWAAYGEPLEANLRDLSERLKRGAYPPSPARRVSIPQGDGRQRLIGIPTLEDTIVQRATGKGLNALYEQDFRGFRDGFRPGRSPHEVRGGHGRNRDVPPQLGARCRHPWVLWYARIGLALPAVESLAPARGTSLSTGNRVSGAWRQRQGLSTARHD